MSRKSGSIDLTFGEDLVAQNRAILSLLRETHGSVPEDVRDFILHRNRPGRRLAKVQMALQRVVGIAALGLFIAFCSIELSMAGPGVSAVRLLDPSAFLIPVDVVGRVLPYGGPADMAGYLAALSMLLTFSMRNAVPMRVFALLTNTFFLVYATELHLGPVLLLHSILLPLNLSYLVRAVHDMMARRHLARV